MEPINRRKFIDFVGKGVVGVAFSPLLLNACDSKSPIEGMTFTRIEPTTEDDVILANGFKYEVLVKWGDDISEVDTFGYNNDYTAYIPMNDSEGILWVNHEYIDPKFVSGYYGDIARMRVHIDKEMYNVGGTIVKIKNSGGKWSVVKNDPINKRITGKTMIPFAWQEPIAGKTEAMGTVANCAGGVTPWGTILTCEENYDMFYGETSENGNHINSQYDWEAFYNNPPEHYGWVVEINPMNGNAKKLVALGRFSHECATVKELADGRLVVYSGDDINDGCLYKFISDKPGSLETGSLYVADLESGKWLKLDVNIWGELKGYFRSQTELMIGCRRASRMIGGSALDRPEDIEIDPVSGDVFVSLTNNKPKGNYYGSILKLRETGGDYASESFEWDTFLTGGEETGFACPDNLAFDNNGNLWFTSDVSGNEMRSDIYSKFGNNGLYMVQRNGDQAGEVIQIASAPVDAEFTGPTFTPDGKYLFLSVQHPGETTATVFDYDFTSHWPDGGMTIPKSAVIVVSSS